MIWVAKQREEVDIRLKWKHIKQVKCVYMLGGVYQITDTSGDGGATQETCRNECVKKNRER